MKKIACSLAKLLLTGSIVVSTSAILNAQRTTNSTNASSANAEVMSDTAFIRKNIVDNMTEIQLAQLGAQKSTDPRLKTMSQQMVADHTQILNDLQTVARQKNMTNIPSGSGNTGMGNPGTSIGSGMGSAAAATGAAASEAASAARTPSGTAAAGMNTTSSGNRALGTGINSAAGAASSGTGTTSASGTGTGTSGTGTTAGAGAGTTSGAATGTAASGAGMTSGGGSYTSSGAGMQHDMQDTMMAMQGMGSMQALQSASGREFNALFVSQMLQLHQAKVAELQSASSRITDPILKTAVTKALPIIRMHRDMLARANNGNASTEQ